MSIRNDEDYEEALALQVRCAKCARVVAGRLLSAMRGGAWHPRPHKSAPNDGEPCDGHKQPGEMVPRGRN